MAEVEIIGVSLRQPGNHPENLISVKTSRGQRMTVLQILQDMVDNKYFVKDKKKTQKSYVVRVRNQHGPDYIRTATEDSEEDQLLKLPFCC